MHNGVPERSGTAGYPGDAGGAGLFTRDAGPGSPGEGISSRGVFAGLLAVAFICWLTPLTDHYLASACLGFNHLPTSALLVQLILIGLVNSVLARFAPCLHLSRRDVGLVYIMCMVTAAIPSWGLFTYLFAVMMGPYYYATPDNRWGEFLHPHLQKIEERGLHLFVRDPVAAEGAELPPDTPRPAEWFFTGKPEGPSLSYSIAEKLGIGDWFHRPVPEDPGAIYSILDWLGVAGWFYGPKPSGPGVPWDALYLPLAHWCIFILAWYAIFLSLSALLRRQWADRERLAFPLVQVPIEMISGDEGQSGALGAGGGGAPGGRGASFFRDRITWIGILVPVVIHSWNAFRDFLPVLPEIPVISRNLESRYFQDYPWRCLAPVHIYITPAIIGLTYLLSLEVSFSLWFFYVLLKAGVVLLYYAGWGRSHWEFMWSIGKRRGIFVDQAFGALLALALYGLWMARGHLKEAVRRAVGLPGGADDSEEPLRYREAFLMLLAGIGVSVYWLMLAGMDFDWALLLTVLFVVVATGMTRLVCEGGLFYVQTVGNPFNFMTSVVTPAGMGESSFVGAQLGHSVMMADLRAFLMPQAMHGFKLASDCGLPRRRTFLAIAAAILLAIGISFVSFTKLCYEKGATVLHGGQSWVFRPYIQWNVYNPASDTVRRIQEYERARKEYAARDEEMPEGKVPEVARTDWRRVGWMALGAGVLILFLVLRSYVFWWPHPIGYVCWGSSWPMIHIWFSFFVGWLLKWGITRYGGFRAYLRMRRFFIGLVVGEAIAAGIWIAIRLMLDRPGGWNIHIG
ncbi:MAG: hypothetical protein N3A38_05760 [Planctomycetota bacterium]|nr:hypothetical protein [Planctomycetota bacterium]